jgi:hypothetical protein
MTLEGTVVNGVVVWDAGARLPEGARVRLEVIDDESYMNEWPDPVDPTLPPDHPHAPYNREAELATLRQSITAMKAGEVGIPLDEAMARIAAELKLPPVDRG